MTLALATQIEAVVFDGVRPAYRDMRVPHAAVFPWLIAFSTIQGDAVDMSGTSGTAGAWSASWSVRSATATVLSVSSATSTAGGSLITFPSPVDGQVQVLLSTTDAGALVGFLEHTLYLTDQFGNQYKAVYGLLYPDSDSG